MLFVCLRNGFSRSLFSISLKCLFDEMPILSNAFSKNFFQCNGFSTHFVTTNSSFYVLFSANMKYPKKRNLVITFIPVYKVCLANFLLLAARL